MSQDISDKIKLLAEMLGQDSMQENIRGLVEMLKGNQDKKADETENTNEQQNYKAIDEAAAKPVQQPERISTGHDPRMNLLSSIKPYMSERRKNKISNCIRVLQIAQIFKLMDIDKE